MEKGDCSIMDMKNKERRLHICVVALQLCKGLIMAVCLCMTVYQGFVTTNKYLNGPLSTEQTLVPLKEAVPTLRLTLCKQHRVVDCENHPQKANDSLKCHLNHGSWPLYLSDPEDTFTNVLEANNQSIEGIEDLIENLSVWDDLNLNWTRLTGFRSGVYPLSGDLVLQCYTSNASISQFSHIKLLPTAKDYLSLYIHNDGELLNEVSRNEQFKVTLNEHDIMVKILIDVNRILRTGKMNCKERQSYFDQCQNQRRQVEFEENCFPPFFPNRSRHQCRKLAEGKSSLHAMQKMYNCLTPCEQIQVDLVSYPSKFVATMAMDKHATRLGAYYLTLPMFVKKTVMMQNYDLVSFIAEFGGWSSLLIGVSLFGLWNTVPWTSMKLKSETIQYFEKIFRFTLLFGLTGLLVWIACYCVIKLASNLVEMDIRIGKEQLNISLSICREIPFKNSSMEESFWGSHSSLANKIIDLEFEFHNETSQTLFSGSYDGSDQFETTNFPTIYGDICFCNTLPIEDVFKLKNIVTTTSTEIFFFLHEKGQLLGNLGNNRLAPINDVSIIRQSSTKVFVSNVVHMNVKLTLNNRINFGDKNASYDNCVFDEIKKGESTVVKEAIDKVLHPNPEDKISFNISREIMANLHDKVLKTMQQNSCPLPVSYLETESTFDAVQDRKSFLGPGKDRIRQKIVLHLLPFSISNQEFISYTWLSAVAELGGWTGLILGLSLLDTSYFMDIISAWCKNAEKKAFIIKKVLLLAAVLGICFILGFCIHKVLSKPTGSSLTFQPYNRLNLTLTSCVYARGYKEKVKMPVYIWYRDQPDESDWKLLYDNSNAGGRTRDTFIVNLNNKIHYCRSVDLKGRQFLVEHNMVSNLKKLVSMYLHETGMFYSIFAVQLSKYQLDTVSRITLTVDTIQRIEEEEKCLVGELFDQCYAETVSMQLMEEVQCVYSNLWTKTEYPVCETNSKKNAVYDASQKVLEPDCKLPCTLNFLRLKTFSGRKISKLKHQELTNFTLTVPRMVTVQETKYIYTWWDSFGEFGGWVGILGGFCVADLAGPIDMLMRKLRAL